MNYQETKCIAAQTLESLIERPEFREEMKNKNMYRSLSKLLFRTNEKTVVLEAYLKLFISLSEWDQYFIDDVAYILGIDWWVAFCIF